MSDLSLFEVFWSEGNKAKIMVYESCSYDNGDELLIHDRLCRVEKRKNVSYQEHTCVLDVTVLDYIGE